MIAINDVRGNFDSVWPLASPPPSSRTSSAASNCHQSVEISTASDHASTPGSCDADLAKPFVHTAGPCSFRQCAFELQVNHAHPPRFRAEKPTIDIPANCAGCANTEPDADHHQSAHRHLNHLPARIADYEPCDSRRPPPRRSAPPRMFGADARAPALSPVARVASRHQAQGHGRHHSIRGRNWWRN